MAMTIILPDDLETLLQRQATGQQVSGEELAIRLLSAALSRESSTPALEEIVATIKAMPSNPNTIRPAQGNLAEVLRSGPADTHFELAEWEQEWATVEAEMKALTRANDRAEGRG